jgi:hypothetical protein
LYLDARDIIVEQQQVFVITKVHGVEENAFQNVVRILQEHETLELPGAFGGRHLDGLFGTWLRSSCIYGCIYGVMMARKSEKETL